MKKCIDFLKTRPPHIWKSWLMFIPFLAELALWPYWFFVKKRTFLLWCAASFILVSAYGIAWIPAFLFAQWSFQRGSIAFSIISFPFFYICGVLGTYAYLLWREKYVKRHKK